MGFLSSLLARFLAQPVRHRGGSPLVDASALAGLLQPGDVLLTEGNTRAAALVRRVTGSAWAHVSMYVGPLDDGPDPRCIVEADLLAGVRAVPLSEFKGQRARILRPIALDETTRGRLAQWVLDRIGDPYDLAHAWALAKWLLRLTSAPIAMARDARRFICSTLLAQAFLFIGSPIHAAEARSVIPRDFESASGFQVVMDSHGLHN
jgi:uncharacterized protein YycO